MTKYLVNVRVAGWKTYLIDVPEGEDLYDSIYEQLDSNLLDPIVDDTYNDVVDEPKEYKK
jgi:hypothetical protein